MANGVNMIQAKRLLRRKTSEKPTRVATDELQLHDLQKAEAALDVQKKARPDRQDMLVALWVSVGSSMGRAVVSLTRGSSPVRRPSPTRAARAARPCRRRPRPSLDGRGEEQQKGRCERQKGSVMNQVDWFGQRKGYTQCLLRPRATLVKGEGSVRSSPNSASEPQFPNVGICTQRQPVQVRISLRPPFRRVGPFDGRDEDDEQLALRVQERGEAPSQAILDLVKGSGRADQHPHLSHRPCGRSGQGEAAGRRPQRRVRDLGAFRLWGDRLTRRAMAGSSASCSASPPPARTATSVSRSSCFLPSITARPDEAPDRHLRGVPERVQPTPRLGRGTQGVDPEGKSLSRHSSQLGR